MLHFRRPTASGATEFTELTDLTEFMELTELTQHEHQAEMQPAELRRGAERPGPAGSVLKHTVVDVSRLSLGNEQPQRT